MIDMRITERLRWYIEDLQPVGGAWDECDAIDARHAEAVALLRRVAAGDGVDFFGPICGAIDAFLAKEDAHD